MTIEIEFRHRYTQIIPATGHKARFAREGIEYNLPLAGFGVTTDGLVLALVSDAEGNVIDVATRARDTGATYAITPS